MKSEKRALNLAVDLRNSLLDKTGLDLDVDAFTDIVVESLLDNWEKVCECTKISGRTSDGCHTFDELYEFRKAYNVALFNQLAVYGRCNVHKSTKHFDGEECFGGGWFIVVAILPGGQISNHYEMKDWDLFKIPATEKALFEYDGHTGADVIERLVKL